eukprot:5666232-Pleurochrysis_carterae.AAC.1
MHALLHGRAHSPRDLALSVLLLFYVFDASATSAMRATPAGEHVADRDAGALARSAFALKVSFALSRVACVALALPRSGTSPPLLFFEPVAFLKGCSGCAASAELV